MRPGVVRSRFDLNSELLPSLPAAAIFLLGRAVMSYPRLDWADPSESELSTQPNSGGVDRPMDDLVEFPPLGSVDLIRLGEDLLHAYPIYHKHRDDIRHDVVYIASVSNLISRGENSAPGTFSSEEATALEATFRKVPFPAKFPPSV